VIDLLILGFFLSHDLSNNQGMKLVFNHIFKKKVMIIMIEEIKPLQSTGLFKGITVKGVCRGLSMRFSMSNITRGGKFGGK
jgi:hypothetical protein